MSTPAPWTLVAAREMQVKLTDRNFLIGTGLTVLLLLAAMIVPSFFGGGSTEYDVAVTDEAATSVVEEAAGSAATTDPMNPMTITAVPVADRAAAEALVLDGEADAALVGQPGGWELLSDGGAPGSLESALAEAVRADAMEANAEQVGTTVDELTRGTELASTDLAPEPASIGAGFAYVLGFAFAMLFYMAALLFGMQIANSVVEEKQSRIVEILAAKIPVRQLLLGKVLGNTVLAFGQIALIAAVSLVGLTFLDLDVALPGLAGAIAWYLPFFVAGFVALACVWAAAGALASRTEDLQTTTMPLTMVLVIILVIGLQLEGSARQIASFVPVASTILMPTRIVAGDVVWWEPYVALAVVVAFCALTITFGARLYERALLHTSGSLSWRRAMALEG